MIKINTMKFITLCILAIVTSTTLALPTSSAMSPNLSLRFKRKLVLVGGSLSDDNAEIYARIVNLAGGPYDARVAIVTAASGDAEINGQKYEELFYQHGVRHTYWVPLHIDNPDAAFDPHVVDEVERATAIFFGGGDQRRLTALLFETEGDSRVPTPLLATMQRLLMEGKAVVAGTSAGAAAATSSVMITGGVSHEALVHGASLDSSDPDTLSYDPLGGLGFVHNCVVDTHFSERGREGRLIRLLADTQSMSLGSSFGVGLDEDTALVVLTDLNGKNADAEVVGRRGVFLANTADALVHSHQGRWAIEGVLTHYLTHGDHVRLSNMSVINFAPFKTDLEEDEHYEEALTSKQIFRGEYSDSSIPEYVAVSTRLVDSKRRKTHGDTYEWNPMFRVSFDKRAGLTRGFGGYDPDHENLFEISYENLLINIKAK